MHRPTHQTSSVYTPASRNGDSSLCRTRAWMDSSRSRGTIDGCQTWCCISAMVSLQPTSAPTHNSGQNCFTNFNQHWGSYQKLLDNCLPEHTGPKNVTITFEDFQGSNSELSQTDVFLHHEFAVFLNTSRHADQLQNVFQSIIALDAYKTNKTAISCSNVQRT